MTRLRRHEYRMPLPPAGSAASGSVHGVVLRPVVDADQAALADLLLAAYRGTIDDDGEELPEAQEAIAAFLADAPLLDASILALVDGSVASAVLVSTRADGPFISFVVSHPAHKRTGLATQVITAVCRRLIARGHDHVSFVITDGNIASKALFTSLGAVQQPS